MALGKRIKEELDKRGWKIVDLERRSGVPLKSISALIVRDSIKSEFAPDFARAFDMPLEELLTGSAYSMHQIQKSAQQTSVRRRND